MEVHVLNPSHSKPFLSDPDPSNDILSARSSSCSSLSVMERLSVESMEDLFDGATQTHTQNTIPSQVPKSLEQKLLDEVVEASLIRLHPNAVQQPIHTSYSNEPDSHNIHFEAQSSRVESKVTEQADCLSVTTSTLITTHADIVSHTDHDSITSIPVSTPELHASPNNLPKLGNPPATETNQSDLHDEVQLKSQSQESSVPHVIIDKASIPGINLAPSAFLNNSYLSDTDHETSNEKSKEPIRSFIGLSPSNPQNRRHSHLTPRTVDIAGSKYILYGRAKSRSLHENPSNSLTYNSSKAISAIREILSGSMKYGFGKLLHQKQWQVEGRHSQQEGRWKYKQAKSLHHP